MANSNEHAVDCAWTLAACGYKATHYYCPHPEHACTCPPTEPVPSPDGPTGAVDDLLVEMAARIGGLTARLPDADAEDRVYVNTLVARVRLVRAALGSTPGGAGAETPKEEKHDA